MKKKLATFCTFTATYAITMMALVPSQAEATDRLVHSGYCHDSNATTPVYTGEQLINPNGGPLGIFCTIPSDSHLNHSSVNTLYIHGYNHPNGATSVKACAWSWSGAGGVCGNSNFTVNGHFNQKVLDLSAWKSDHSWFPYVFVALPPSSKIYGLWMST